MELLPAQIDFLRRNWPLEPEIKFHRRIANFVYFAQVSGRPVVVRLTEPIHRRKAEIASEVDWMRYLSRNGMKIAAPVLANSGAAVVEMPGEPLYFVTVFEWAPGAALGQGRAIDNETIQDWGRYLGRMHRLTKHYRPFGGVRPRQQWSEDESLNMAKRCLDPGDDLPYRALHELLEWMRSLPRERDSYGLIHTDLHHGNFMIDGREITAFDFDDSCYHWFAYDLVAPVNAVSELLSKAGTELSSERVLETMLAGYALENELPAVWLKRFPLFKRYRRALMYHWAKTCIKENAFDVNGLAWARETMPRILELLKEPVEFF